jgi:sulfur-carrier protein
MKVKVKYFASIRESVGVGSEQFDTAAPTLGALRDELIARSDAHAQSLARGRAVRVALNQVMSSEDSTLSEGCEVAFFPPVTGG